MLLFGKPPATSAIDSASHDETEPNSASQIVQTRLPTANLDAPVLPNGRRYPQEISL